MRDLPLPSKPLSSVILPTAIPPFGLLMKDQLNVLKEKVEDLGLDLSKRLN